MQQIERTPEQLTMLKRIRSVLGAGSEEGFSGVEAKIRKANRSASPAAAQVVQRSKTR
jgi:hypothetical protein